MDGKVDFAGHLGINPNDKTISKFEDLPDEIIKSIIRYSNKKYPWLFVCKKTIIPAGQFIYLDEFTKKSPKPEYVYRPQGAVVRYQRPFDGFIRLLDGLIDIEQSKSINIVKNLFQHISFKDDKIKDDKSNENITTHHVKVEFLKIVKTLDLTSEDITPISRKTKNSDLHKVVKSFENFQQNSIIVFPGLKNLTIDISGTKIQDPVFMLQLVNSITNVSQPDYFCWTFDYPLWYQFKSKTPQPGLPHDLNELQLTFAKGYLPKVVIHHIKAKPDTAILPVYGTLNRFDFCYKAKVFGVMKFEECVKFFAKILGPHLSKTNDEELNKLKDQTRYQIQGFCGIWLHIPDISTNKKAEMLTGKLVELHPELKGRLEFIEVGIEHHESVPCQGCGRTMSAYMTFIMNNWTWKKLDLGADEDPDNPLMMAFMPGSGTK
ncbi:uncharacterized protein I206_103465 [Kwoniella pini CBS 10737]|uniref:Uncharacterized protein n=1 Tax=Kwoniella pini CBS 10737 TaxID=1296096 RepID=A0A1B9I9P3_9TREE|nr:uncharacterized protein I206_01532 [Kwoniella pini CBS 10737]OCF52246.1 hypothetical protein I206_01532 [Kwoniella pini CBS 10737]